jgi:hypothetical protein
MWNVTELWRRPPKTNTAKSLSENAKRCALRLPIKVTTKAAPMPIWLTIPEWCYHIATPITAGLKVAGSWQGICLPENPVFQTTAIARYLVMPFMKKNVSFVACHMYTLPCFFQGNVVGYRLHCLRNQTWRCVSWGNQNAKDAPDHNWRTHAAIAGFDVEAKVTNWFLFTSLEIQRGLAKPQSTGLSI